MSSKKSSKATPPDAKYQIRDVVLAKVRGYPPWPAMIVDPEAVSKSVKKERPVSKKTTFYCVRFFPAGDHAWAVAKDISRLLPHEIEAYINEPSKKNGDLKRGYEIALDPASWEKEREQLQADVEAAEEEEEEGVDQLDESDGGEDELDGEDGTSKKKKSANKKRKRESASAEDLKKKRKSNQEALSAKRRPIAGGKKGAKGKAGSTDNVESEDGEKAEDDDTGDKKSSSKKASKGKGGDAEDRPTKRTKKEKEEAEDAEDAALADDPEAQRVKEWRHKLQRAFLTAKSPPQPQDMPAYDQIFSTVERYDGLTIDYLQFSKIGKVMRRIASMESIPRDEEFHFKERASKLVTTWQAIIQAAEAEAESGGKTNGVASKDEDATEGQPAAGVNGKPEASQDADMVNGDNATTTKEAPAVNGVTEAITEQKDEGEAAMDTSDS